MRKQLSLIIRASAFAARFHGADARKGEGGLPYVTHPLEVARILLEEGGITDEEVLAAAILHDTIEDTNAKAQEIRDEFGERVCSLVLEVTDDKGLEKLERKRRQVTNAPNKSADAAAIKLADKIANVRDVTFSPPNWDLNRRIEYIRWASLVVNALPPINARLRTMFDGAVEGFNRSVIQ